MQCKLCLEEHASLEKSHYIPAGVYRALRENLSKNPDPYQLTPNVAFQTSSQMTAQLLCRTCEGRFNKKGENWVLRHFLKADRRFRLETILKAANPVSTHSDFPSELYHAVHIPKIDIEALSYFAASVFWRGSIYPWTPEGKIPVPLGLYKEQFRKYLMGLAPFPNHAVLWVIVRQNKNFDRAVSPPWGGRTQEGHFAYNLSIPGLAFTLLVGKRIPSLYKRYCFLNGEGNPIIATTLVDQLLREHASKMKTSATR